MRLHIVKAGESLYGIAASYRIADWRVIYMDSQNAQLRKIRPNPDLIQPGDRLFIPDSGMAATMAGGPPALHASIAQAPPFKPGAWQVPRNQIAQDNTWVARRPVSMPKPPPEPLAEDFEPDFAFYEYLAHDFAYLNGQGGTSAAGFKTDKFLYRCVNPLGSILLAPRPLVTLPPAYAVSSKQPYSRTSSLPPLYYTITEMPGSDPNNKAHGVFAYWLQPSRGHHPIVVIRGTEPQGAADLLADLDRTGIGHDAFAQTRASFQSLFKRIDRKDVVVVGHSLGGAMAQRVAVEFADMIAQVATFNSPGIDKKTADRFKVLKGPSVTHHVTQGDVVSLAGETLIAGDVCQLEGAATAELHRLLKNGTVRTVDNLITHMLSAVYVVAVEKKYLMQLSPSHLNLMNLGTLLGTAGSEWIHGGVKAAKSVGGAIGDLHSQRLLGPGSGAKATRFVVRSQSPGDERINNSSVERVRKQRLGALDIATLFLNVTRQIDDISKALGKALVKDVLNYDSPFARLARELIGPLSTLRVALNELGGLEGLVAKALHLPPPKVDFEGLQAVWQQAVRDKTYVAPSPQQQMTHRRKVE